MTRDAHQALVTADSIADVQCPPQFDYQASLTRVRKIKSRLEAIVGRAVTLDDAVQDATYFASLQILERVELPILHDTMAFALQFSCFGDLFAISTSESLTDMPESLIGKVVALVESYGFIYVPAISLDAAYDGPNPSFAGSTWRHRFFDYV